MTKRVVDAVSFNRNAASTSTYGGVAMDQVTGDPADTPGRSPGRGQADQMLCLATVGFLVNFWAWALISPLGAAYKEDLRLSAFQQALLVAVPVVVGSLGRIALGTAAFAWWPVRRSVRAS